MTRIDELSALIQLKRGVLEQSFKAPFVVWDGYGLEQPFSGVGRYAQSLAEELQRLDVHPVLVGDLGACRQFPALPSFMVEREGLRGRLLRLKFLWPQQVGQILGRSVGADDGPVVLHGLSNFNIPLWPRKARFKRVLTVHDVIPLLDPGSVSRAYRLQFAAVFGRALTLADAVVCVSQWTQRTLLERFPKIAGKTVVIRNGLAPAPVSVESLGERSTAFSPHILCVSRYEKYKRIDFIAKILRQLPHDWHATLVTDPKGKLYLEQVSQDLISARRLRLVTGISSAALNDLYLASHIYVQPSQFEGFCLPVVESLQNGSVVVFQSGSAIDEVMHPSVGIGLDQAASPRHWAEACETAWSMRQSPAWPGLLRDHVASLPRWAEAAQSLKNLYNSLG